MKSIQQINSYRSVRLFTLFIICSVFTLSATAQKSNAPTPFNALKYVRALTGTGLQGHVSPIAAAPFGMANLAVDTYYYGSGYNYCCDEILGISHTHKSGCPCGEYQDIRFFPLTGTKWNADGKFQEVKSKFSHKDETAEPGYYQVRLTDYDINVELTATERCGFHRYTFPQTSDGNSFLLMDMKAGAEKWASMIPKNDFDTVRAAKIEVVDPFTVRGYRISDGWAWDQRVYFYAHTSKIIESATFFQNGIEKKDVKNLEGTDVRVVLRFKNQTNSAPLFVSVGISPVSIEGAENNWRTEARGKMFDTVKQETQKKWNDALSMIRVNDADSEQKRMFYTSLYLASQYPQLYCDVDGSYRSSDSKVYKDKFRYFAGVLGLWDTFRTQDPLMAILHPDVINDLVQTFLAHYDHSASKTLPLWVIAGKENQTQIGYHAMPIIADAYSKGIRNYDAEAVFQAMKNTSVRDTFDYSRAYGQYRGMKAYLKYHYVPLDFETNSVAKALEYCYDDWCIARMAKMLGHEDDFKTYCQRAQWYSNIFDKGSQFFRARDSKGEWRKPFDSYYITYYDPTDDYCEGSAWQWLFFVPHDAKGLMKLFGSKEKYIQRLDSVFNNTSNTHPNEWDHSVMIGQYNHGNEPCHHVAYLYDYAGQPWKCQKYVSKIMRKFYHPSPNGLSGDDDTGQMSAWYVMSAMGFYPVTQGEGVYAIGTPMFKSLSVHHPHGVLTILAPNTSDTNCYIQSVTLNGKPYTRNWFSHNEIFKGKVTIVFNMGATPNTAWGSKDRDVPPSLSDK